MNIPVESTAVALSADGSVVLGSTYNAASLTRAFLWTKETGPVDLSPDPDLVIYAIGLSGNGQIAVGEYKQQIDNPRPFFWSAETGLQTLGISNFEHGYTFGVDYDGSVIVGYVTATNGGRTNYACRWINRGEAQLLDPLVGESHASAVTPDGSVIVGNASGADDRSRAFRWSFRSGMEWIEAGNLFDAFGFVDLSADGQRLVGNASTTNDVHVGILWTEESGIQDLNQAFGSTLPRGWRFCDATAISADGRWIVGALENSHEMFRGYILDTGRPR